MLIAFSIFLNLLFIAIYDKQMQSIFCGEFLGTILAFTD